MQQTAVFRATSRLPSASSAAQSSGQTPVFLYTGVRVRDRQTETEGNKCYFLTGSLKYLQVISQTHTHTHTVLLSLLSSKCHQNAQMVRSNYPCEDVWSLYRHTHSLPVAMARSLVIFLFRFVQRETIHCSYRTNQSLTHTHTYTLHSFPLYFFMSVSVCNRMRITVMRVCVRINCHLGEQDVQDEADPIQLLQNRISFRGSPTQLVQVSVHFIHLLLILQVHLSHHSAAGAVQSMQPPGRLLTTDHRLPDDTVREDPRHTS